MFLTSKTGVMSALMAAGDNMWQLTDTFMKTLTYDKFNPKKGFEKVIREIRIW